MYVNKFISKQEAYYLVSQGCCFCVELIKLKYTLFTKTLIYNFLKYSPTVSAFLHPQKPFLKTFSPIFWP